MMNQDMLRDQRKQKQLLEQTEVIERPGNISGFTALYDSGTFAPTLVGAGTPGTFTYDATNTHGEWTRIGNRVIINGRVRITAVAVAPVGAMSINGLPIVAATTPNAGVAAMGSWTGFTLTAGYTQVAGRILSATSVINLAQSGSNVAGATLQGAAFGLVGGAADFLFSGEYRV